MRQDCGTRLSASLCASGASASSHASVQYLGVVCFDARRTGVCQSVAVAQRLQPCELKTS